MKHLILRSGLLALRTGDYSEERIFKLSPRRAVGDGLLRSIIRFLVFIAAVDT
jgi:hypothetical protein